MTWYASEILAACNASLLDAVRSNPPLAARSYLIREPIDFALNGSTHTFVPPGGGLLVVRPVCDPEEHCAEWHEEPALSWHSLSGHGGSETITPKALGQHVGDDMLDEFPPATFFAYLKQLSAETNSRLAFFRCSMWGGDIESEYLWLFGTREEAAIVLQAGVKSQVAQVGRQGDVHLREVDLLSEALAYLGAPIPSSFWVPHTRGFPWKQYRLRGASSNA